MKDRDQFAVPENFTPLAFYHKNLMNYHPVWKLEDILLFEKMVVMWKISKNGEIFYQDGRLQRELRIGRGRLKKAFEKLLGLGYLEIIPVMRGAVKKYRLNEKKIVDNIERIYDFNKIKDKQEKKDRVEILQGFMKLYLRTSYKGAPELREVMNELEVDENKALDIMNGRFNIFGS